MTFLRRSERTCAIAEPNREGFPDRPGITSAAQSAGDIVPQARDALASAGDLPRAIEDGAAPPVDLAEYEDPLIVVIPFTAVAKEAA